MSDAMSPPAAAALSTRHISEIQIGVRHRRDLGDIEGLAGSIAKIGLLNPITVDENGRLLAGARRLRQRPLRGQR
jgi:ParB family transcriptional regulator, chromosome partitioning protein